MTLSDVIGEMRSAGCSEKQINDVILALSKKPHRLVSDAERQAHWRAQTGLTTRGWAELRAKIFERDKFRCRKCGAAEDRSDGRTILNCDHIVAVKNGGSTEPSNLMTLCCSCHSKKTRSESVFGATRHATETTQPTNDATRSADLFGHKTLLRVETDEHMLDEITDIWNAWAPKHGCPRVKFLSKSRAQHWRNRMKDITNGEGPAAAFRKVLDQCERSFFVRGSPRSRLKFDQLLKEGFLIQMLEGAFEYQETRQWRS